MLYLMRRTLYRAFHNPKHMNYSPSTVCLRVQLEYGVFVKDAAVAFDESVARGAKPVLPPTFVPACPAASAALGGNGCYIAEVELYGDVVFRYVSPTETQVKTKKRQQRQPLILKLCRHPFYRI